MGERVGTCDVGTAAAVGFRLLFCIVSTNMCARFKRTLWGRSEGCMNEMLCRMRMENFDGAWLKKQ